MPQPDELSNPTDDSSPPSSFNRERQRQLIKAQAYQAAEEDFALYQRFYQERFNALISGLQVSDQPSPTTVAQENRALSKSASELAKEFSVTDRAIQQWFNLVCRAYPWIEIHQLRTGSSDRTRYTPLCQQLFAEYRESGMHQHEWVEDVWLRHPEESEPYRDCPPANPNNSNP